MRKVLYILGQLSDQDADWLAASGERLRLGPGGELVAMGQRLDRLFIILEGELQILVAGRQEVARVGVGDMIGEMSFVDDSPASASVVAVSAVQVLAIERARISQRMAADTAFAARFYKAIAVFLADRMRNVLARFGYGDVSDDAAAARDGELDSQVMDNLHLAGGRFDRILKKLMA